ncbi:unnamed protein product [Blepharisma stoltei]|uniref:Uncharacterized protein n=1 Tax=Blepharisma stoltei TaxID=1481888 RepID=A0AAU9JYI9_9CILI|nr:unnamed protein product [Blepharisma stoltei]
MYNVYIADKLSKQKETEESLHAQGLLYKEKKKKLDESLTESYRKRMNETIIKLAKDLDNKKSPRSSSATPRKVVLFTHRGSLKDQDRIKDAIEKSKWLDTSPSHRPIFRLRQRDKSKEIQPPMYQRPRTVHERLLDTIKFQRSYYDTSLPPNSNYKTFYKDFTGSSKQSFGGGKEVNSYYHVKTHFKTIESMALDLHKTIRSDNKSEVRQKIAQEKQGLTKQLMNRTVILPDNNNEVSFEIKNLSDFEIILSKQDVVPLSNELLHKYRVWKPNLHENSFHFKKQLK